MTEAARLAEQMRRVMVGGAWFGPSLLESLDGLEADAAAAYPIPGAHSVWELVAHIDATQKLLAGQLRGENPTMSEADFFPPVADPSPAAWKEAVTRLRTQEDALIVAVASLTDQKLAEPIAPGGSTVSETFLGHTQHNAFHTGQIRLLRKALGAKV